MNHIVQNGRNMTRVVSPGIGNSLSDYDPLFFVRGIALCLRSASRAAQAHIECGSFECSSAARSASVIFLTALSVNS